ncbi:hypothetical protein ACG2LH_07630 [Zhouia sp. PK063]|uniref:hypothetical protein n=1 Tax=Zhouia sp. PK063 TaxID=3373602 RepID=UPI00379A802F
MPVVERYSDVDCEAVKLIYVVTPRLLSLRALKVYVDFKDEFWFSFDDKLKPFYNIPYLYAEELFKFLCDEDGFFAFMEQTDIVCAMSKYLKICFSQNANVTLLKNQEMH